MGRQGEKEHEDSPTIPPVVLQESLEKTMKSTTIKGDASHLEKENNKEIKK